MQRSACSIPSNIAEGSGGISDKQLVRYLSIAIGSSCELETQVIISNNLGLLQESDYRSIIKEIIEIRKMIIGFKKVKQHNS